MVLSASEKIEISPIGFVKRTSSDGKARDKSLVSRIVLRRNLVKAWMGLKNFPTFSLFIGCTRYQPLKERWFTVKVGQTCHL